MAGPHDGTSGATTALLHRTTEAAPAPQIGRQLDLIRPDARLRLHVSLIGGRVDPISNRILPLLGEEPIYFVLSFGPQHTAEPTLSAGDPATAGASPHRVAAPSRVVLEVPPGTPFAVDSLLRLADFPLSLDPRADRRRLPGRDLRKGEPAPTETAIEVPVGLVLSPTPHSTFVAEPPGLAADGIAERWGARLARPRRDASGQLRALYSRPGDPTWSVPLDEAERQLVVDATATGDALSVARLVLTADGADVELDGAWDSGRLAGYRHRAASGRDLEVVTIERGYLAPFGHAATLTTITERRTEPDGDGEPTAALYDQTFLTITDPVVDGLAPHTPVDGRALPFIRIEAADGRSGPVDTRAIEQRNNTSIDTEQAAIVTRGSRDLRIEYRATDRDGNGGIAFDLPAIFVFEDVAYEPRADDGTGRTTLARLARWFRTHPAMTTADLDGQPVAWAEPPTDPDAAPAGSTQDTEWIRFRLDRPDVDDNDQAAVDQVIADLEAAGRPAFSAAVLRASVIDRSSATVGGATPPTLEVVVADRYLTDGTGDGNPDLGYLDLADPDDPPAENVPATDADGILQLGVVVDTFGQSLGGAAKELLDGFWNPEDALAGLPKLLGAIDLTDLLPPIDINEVFGSGGGNGGNGGAGSGPALPTITVEPIEGDGGFSLPEGVCVELAWEPKLQSFPKGDGTAKTFVVAADHQNDGNDLGLPSAVEVYGTDADTRARFSITTCIPGDTTVDVSLDRFALLLPPAFPVIGVLFDRVAVLDVSGSGTLDTKLADWLFVGALNWLEPIKDLLLDGLGLGSPETEDRGDGFGLDVDIPIPSLQLGIVGISGIGLGLDLDLPTDGSSQVGFNLSAKEDPFTLTIFGVGGIGHFVVEVDANRIVRIEASLGVTYETAIDVFIVSAAISIAVGAWVEIRFNPDKTEEVIFGAYAEVGAAASILGLVKISGKVMVGLTYRPGPKRLKGVARVTGEVESIFGGGTASHDVSIEIELGDGADKAAFAPGLAQEEQPTLTFGDRYDNDQWNDYCGAFVAAA